MGKEDNSCLLDVDTGLDHIVIVIGIVGISLALGMILLKVLGIT